MPSLKHYNIDTNISGTIRSLAHTFLYQVRMQRSLRPLCLVMSPLKGPQFSLYFLDKATKMSTILYEKAIIKRSTILFCQKIH